VPWIFNFASHAGAARDWVPVVSGDQQEMLDAEISLSTWGRLYGLPFQWLTMLITCHNESDEAFDR